MRDKHIKKQKTSLPWHIWWSASIGTHTSPKQLTSLHLLSSLSQVQHLLPQIGYHHSRPGGQPHLGLKRLSCYHTQRVDSRVLAHSQSNSHHATLTGWTQPRLVTPQSGFHSVTLGGQHQLELCTSKVVPTQGASPANQHTITAVGQARKPSKQESVPPTSPPTTVMT